MSHGVKARNARKGSGRVTPSKLRRTAVVAADGALAIGAGAIGGLFATTTGTASATAPATGWTATQAPLPTTPDPPTTTNQSVSINGESCAAATFCVAGGSYEGSSASHGLFDVLSGGSWTTMEAPLPANAEAASFSKVESVSCPTTGWCSAVGVYDNTSGREDSFIDILSGGSWTSMEAPVPSDAQPETSAQTFLKSVDCQTGGDCVAFGAYKNAAGPGHPVGFFDTLANGSWTAQTAPQPSDAAVNQSVLTELVS
jgi:hypothetical protein